MRKSVNLLKPNLTPHKDFSPSQKRLQIPEISPKFIICHRGLLLIYFGNRINQALCFSFLHRSFKFFLPFILMISREEDFAIESWRKFSFETYEKKIGKSSDFTREINKFFSLGKKSITHTPGALFLNLTQNHSKELRNQSSGR